MSTTVTVLVVIAVVVIAVLWYFAVYNDFVRLRNLVAESWRQVDVELQRRHELIPNLVATAERAAAFERGTLEAVTAARVNAAAASAAGSEVTGVVTAETALTNALSRLSAVAEQYPDLGAIRNYLSLQSDLGDAEDRIAATRRLYNANVRALNTKIESIPATVVATLHHVLPAQYFDLTTPDARSAVPVATLFRSPDRPV
ncbi:LemA family protein [Nocardia sp. NPDC057668]|uniref:LemA family protein n=1 Tax=Nocardia sp. NPDC057668 TaxID=3346202 RepID=UPI00366AD075